MRGGHHRITQVLRTLLLSQDETRWPELIVLAEIAINGAPIANTEYSPFYLNFGYHSVFWWDFPDRQEPGSVARKEAVRGMVHRMKDDWRMVREAFKNEKDMAAAYADRRLADYQFKKGQDVLINRRRHYRGQFGSDRGPLAPRAV